MGSQDPKPCCGRSPLGVPQMLWFQIAYFLSVPSCTALCRQQVTWELGTHSRDRNTRLGENQKPEPHQVLPSLRNNRELEKVVPKTLCV